MRSVLTVNPTLAVSRLGQDPYEMTTQAAGAVFPFVMQQGLRASLSYTYPSPRDRTRHPMPSSH